MNFHLYHAGRDSSSNRGAATSSVKVLLAIRTTRPGRTMESEQGKAASPSNTQFVFFNDRGLRAGWRILIFIGLLLVIGAVLLTALGVVAMMAGAPKSAGAAIGSPLFVLLSELVPFLAVVLASFLMSRIERRSMGTYGLPLNKQSISQFVTGYILWGFVPLTLLLLLMRGLGVFYFGNVGLHPLDALRWAGAWGAVFLSVGLLEEYLSRGYVLTTLAEGIGFWPAAIIMAVLFGWAHMGNGGETRIGILDTALFGFFTSVTFRCTGSLWLAVGAHAGWDWAQSFFYGVNNSGLQVPGHLFNPHVQGPIWLSGGSVGPEGSVLSSLLLVLMTIAFLAIYRDHREPALVVTSAPREPNAVV
jgi:membrane protease YdiL (CAAX protease family)